jgi:hypothetical protein
MTPPDWLARHDGELRLAPDGRTRLVIFDGGPQYQLTPVPAEGRHACMIIQTVNGRRIDTGQTHATADEAVRGGLDDLRTFLGW